MRESVYNQYCIVFFKYLVDIKKNKFLIFIFRSSFLLYGILYLNNGDVEKFHPPVR